MYIGSSCNLKARIHSHFLLLRNKRHENYKLREDVDNYGIENFEWKILIYCNKEDLLKKEQLFINKYNSTNLNCGYNLALKTNRFEMTDEVRERMRKTKEEKKQRESLEKLKQEFVSMPSVKVKKFLEITREELIELRNNGKIKFWKNIYSNLYYYNMLDYIKINNLTGMRA